MVGKSRSLTPNVILFDRGNAKDRHYTGDRHREALDGDTKP
jgi:hypothetical protein